MCGFSGLLDTRVSTTESDLHSWAAAMAETLRHRGPDDAGVWADPKWGFGVGFRRLAILDLSHEGHQPMVSADGRLVLAFNGEIYNHQELRRELESTGVRFRGTSDTEVWLEAMATWGLDAAFRRANGMFAAAIFDRTQATLTLVRDRLGEKPLYYSWAGSTLLFGSELKALRVHPHFEKEVDRAALDMYFRFGYVPAPHTIYRGTKKLHPGTYMTIRLDSAGAGDPIPYWDAVASATTPVDPSRWERDGDAIDALHDLLADSVRLRMVADVPVGSFLSGGVDSSTVVALMQRQSDRPVRTFTIGFSESSYNEAVEAKAVARHLGTDHTELYVTPPEAMAVIPSLPAIYDEPFGDSSQIPTLLVSGLARSQVVVSLSGDGGDEVFGGYDRHRIFQRAWHGLRLLPVPVRRVASAAIRSVPASVWDRLGARLGRGPARGLGRRTGERAYKLARALGARDKTDVYRLLLTRSTASGLVRGVGEPLSNPLDNKRLDLPQMNPFEWAMLVDELTYLPDDILTKVDRATMSVSLEGRIPLLDHRLIEFAGGLPHRMRFRDGQGKWALRRVLDRYVPRTLIDRPKMGFGVPVGVWIRGPLRDWAEDLLLPSSVAQDGYLNAEMVAARWKEHLSGRVDRTSEIWDILMFQAWLRSTQEATI